MIANFLHIGIYELKARQHQIKKGFKRLYALKPLYFLWCRRPDLNRHGSPHYPLKIACLPSSTTSARSMFYSVLAGWSEGVSVGGAGASGAVSDAGSVCSMGAGASMTIDFPDLSPDIYASINDVSMNKMAAAVVALLKKVDAPVLPKSVWLEPPPNAAPMSAPFPV